MKGAKPCNRLMGWGAVLLLAPAMMACTALEGVNVGVNVPLGGIVNVGASKTIGDAPPSSTPRQSPSGTPAEDAATPDAEKGDAEKGDAEQGAGDRGAEGVAGENNAP